MVKINVTNVWTNNLLDQTSFYTKIFSGPQFFWPTKSFWTKLFLDSKFSTPNFFGQKFLRTRFLKFISSFMIQPKNLKRRYNLMNFDSIQININEFRKVSVLETGVEFCKEIIGTIRKVWHSETSLAKKMSRQNNWKCVSARFCTQGNLRKSFWYTQ